METNLQDLIEKIKKEGVSEAKEKSQEIIQNAKEESEKIIKSAKEEAEKIKHQAEEKAKEKEDNAEAAIQQSMRDVILVTREKLIKLFETILRRNISESMTPEFLKDLIVTIIDKWAMGKDDAFEVFVNEKDKQELENFLFSKLQDKAKENIEIKISENINKGFRFGVKGKEVYYDFSDESISEALKELITPTVAKILDENQ